MTTTLNTSIADNIRKIIQEELQQDHKNTIPLETNGFVETHDINEVPLMMATKRVSYGLYVVFYGKDDYAVAPDPDKPFYVWHLRLNQREKGEIEQNIVEYGYDSWFDIWFDIAERLRSVSPRIKWFKRLSDARGHAFSLWRSA